MPRVIITALLLLAALAYAVLFTTWNMEPVKVVGWRMGGQELWESIPLAYVALAGVALGVLAMVVATLCAWLGQRAQIKKMASQIQRAKEVLEEQSKRIEELEAALAEAHKQLQAAQQAAEEQAVAVEAPAAEQPATEQPQTASEEDDDEVI